MGIEELSVLALGSVKEEGDDPATDGKKSIHEIRNPVGSAAFIEVKGARLIH